MLPATFEGASAADGTIIVAAHIPIDNVRRRALTRLGPAGVFEYVTRPGPAEAHHDPNVLSGSKTVLFTVNTPQRAVIAAVPLAGGDPHILLSDARKPRYTSAGRLVFQRATSVDLMSIAFDPDRLQVSGDRVRLATAATVVDSVGFDVAREGTIIYSAPDDTTSAAGFTTVMVDRTGKDSTVLTEMGSWAEPRISPDGRTLVLRDVVSPNCNLWAIDLQRGARTRVTLEGDNHNPVWRSDGQLTWSSALEESRSMRMAQIDRPSRITALPPSPNERMPESWSRDGQQLAFTEIHPQTGRDIFILSVTSGAVRCPPTDSQNPYTAIAAKRAIVRADCPKYHDPGTIVSTRRSHDEKKIVTRNAHRPKPRAGLYIAGALPAFDPVVLLRATLLFGVVCLIACSVPLGRAIRINAIEALRYEQM